jgi:hypothetical protein
MEERQSAEAARKITREFLQQRPASDALTLWRNYA